MKVIGSIVNHSQYTLRMLDLTVSYLDAVCELLDVQTEWLRDVKFLPPGQSVDFVVERKPRYDSTGRAATQQAPTSARARLADFTIFDESKNGHEPEDAAGLK